MVWLWHRRRNRRFGERQSAGRLPGGAVGRSGRGGRLVRGRHGGGRPECVMSCTPGPMHVLHSPPSGSRHPCHTLAAAAAIPLLPRQAPHFATYPPPTLAASSPALPCLAGCAPPLLAVTARLPSRIAVAQSRKEKCLADDRWAAGPSYRPASVLQRVRVDLPPACPPACPPAHPPRRTAACCRLLHGSCPPPIHNTFWSTSASGMLPQQTPYAATPGSSSLTRAYS